MSSTHVGAERNLVPAVPFVMRWKYRDPWPPKDIPVLNGCANTIDWDQNQSDLSDLLLSMRRMTGSPWIADFRSWTWPEVAIPVANQKDRGLWEREWAERRKLTCLPPVMRRGTFGFSLTLWRSRRRPRCRCLKSLFDPSTANDFKGLITWAGMMSVCWDLGTFVKRNKNQLRDYMTAGPARLAEIPVSRCRDPG